MKLHNLHKKLRLQVIIEMESRPNRIHLSICYTCNGESITGWKWGQIRSYHDTHTSHVNIGTTEEVTKSQLFPRFANFSKSTRDHKHCHRPSLFLILP